jgi:hypothetical protein
MYNYHDEISESPPLSMEDLDRSVLIINRDQWLKEINEYVFTKSIPRIQACNQIV